MFHRQLINICVHMNVSAHVHNQRQSLVLGVNNFGEMLKFLWNMFYYNDINSGIYQVFTNIIIVMAKLFHQ